jgi:hypothetical protein
MYNLCGDQYAFFIKPRSVLLRMRNDAQKDCRENQTARFLLIFSPNTMPFDR